MVAEFDMYLHDELDLVRGRQRRPAAPQHGDLDLVLVPEMTGTCAVRGHGDGAHERRAHQPDERLRAPGIDIKKLARDGVTIFFTQVFPRRLLPRRHAPGQHPGQPRPATFGRYIALDFGIIGTLTESDKDYLAQNFIAFFRRDYKRVAELHIASGWVPLARGWTRWKAPCGPCASPFRPPAEGNLAGSGVDASVPDLAPLQRRDPAAAGAAAKRC